MCIHNFYVLLVESKLFFRNDKSAYHLIEKHGIILQRLTLTSCTAHCQIKVLRQNLELWHNTLQRSDRYCQVRLSVDIGTSLQRNCKL